MSRSVRYIILCVIFAVITTGSLAQSGGGNARPVPQAPPKRPFTDVYADMDDILANPLGALEAFLTEGGLELKSDIDAFPRSFDDFRYGIEAAVRSNAFRIMALAFGLLALLFPDKTKYFVWGFIGALLGLIFSYLPQSYEMTYSMSREMSFMAREPGRTIGLVLIASVFGVMVISPLFFFAFSGLMSLSIGIIALSVTGAQGNDVTAIFTVASIVGFILALVISNRVMVLVPSFVGAALIVMALGLSTSLIIPLALFSMLIMIGRLQRAKGKGKRIPLPSLQLQDGKVDLRRNSDNRSQSEKSLSNRHLHEILPEMADDRDEPLIGH